MSSLPGPVRVRIEPYRLPLRRPLRTARGVLACREGALVRVEAGGLVGVGEVAPLPAFGGESLEEALAAVEAWSPGGELPATPSARHGAEQALLVLEAAHRGCTLAEVLSPRPRARVPLNALVDHVGQALRAVEAGFRTLKLKVGFDVDDDVRRVREVRRAVGPEVALRLDANGGWTEAQARRAIEALAPLDVEQIEEPVADLEAMARLRGPIPLAVDERCVTEADLDRVLALGAADRVVVKPMRVGGATAALHRIDRVRAAGLEAVVTTSLEAAPGRLLALAVAAARDLPACGLDTGGLLAADLDAGFAIEGGEAVVPLSGAA